MGLVWVLFGLLGVAQASGPVEVSVFYESKCPDSDYFFHHQLRPTYEKLDSYLNVELVPYGNAQYRGRHDEYTFTCQHGPDECYGNMVQACFVELVNKTQNQIDFVNCAFEVRNQRLSIEKCITDLELRRRVKKCVESPLGKNLLYQMAKKTDALNPKQSFIPWITINGKGSRSMNDKATQDFLSIVCDELSEEKPQECVKNKQNILRRFRSTYF